MSLDQRVRDNIYTDLALEARELAGESAQNILQNGVTTDTEHQEKVLITRVQIETEAAGKALGKQPGYYVTLEAAGLRGHDRDELEIVMLSFAKELENIIKKLGFNENDSCLIVGLGNWQATPDALGPRAVKKLLVTRHLGGVTPTEKAGGLRPLSALAPGVLGITGIETSEIVRGVVERVKPKFVIAIDSLASRNTERVGAAIQIADTGIHPGSGLGNRRQGITRSTLGVPVIALGVPTVVDARTIVYDALAELEKVLDHGGISKANVQNLMSRVLTSYFNSLIVTPKEIDELIDNLARVVAGGLNVALHPGVGPKEVLRYLN